MVYFPGLGTWPAEKGPGSVNRKEEGNGNWQGNAPVFDTQHLKIFSTDTPVGLQDYHRWYMDEVVCVCV